MNIQTNKVKKLIILSIKINYIKMYKINKNKNMIQLIKIISFKKQIKVIQIKNNKISPHNKGILIKNNKIYQNKIINLNKVIKD